MSETWIEELLILTLKCIREGELSEKEIENIIHIAEVYGFNVSEELFLE
jgi:hypothetical protein